MLDHHPARLALLTPPLWKDYELLDTGDGKKLERFGSYRLVRPETQALWAPALPEQEWHRADAIFQRRQSDDGPGDWLIQRPLPEQWPVYYNNLLFWIRLTPFRHTGIFPEHSGHWEWMRQIIAQRPQPPRVLVLFGYTGLMTLYAASLGAYVCHVDASKPAVRWAQENQRASQLGEHPIRWIVDDVTKFVAREIRRAQRYDLIVMDPPVFGRGPKGEIWRLGEALPRLLQMCVELLSEHPCGLLINAYATSFSALTLYNLLSASLSHYHGETLAGELALIDRADRPLSTALYARWTAR